MTQLGVSERQQQQQQSFYEPLIMMMMITVGGWDAIIVPQCKEAWITLLGVLKEGGSENPEKKKRRK